MSSNHVGPAPLLIALAPKTPMFLGFLRGKVLPRFLSRTIDRAPTVRIMVFVAELRIVRPCVGRGDGSVEGEFPMLSCAATIRRALSRTVFSDTDPFLIAATMSSPLTVFARSRPALR